MTFKKLSDCAQFRESRASDKSLVGWILKNTFADYGSDNGCTVSLTVNELAKLPQVAALLGVAREMVRIHKIQETAGVATFGLQAAQARDALEPFDAR